LCNPAVLEPVTIIRKL